MKSKVKKKKKKKVAPKIKFDIDKLNINQQRFCQLYALNSFLFGNATQCYARAYGYNLDSLSRQGVYSDPDEEGNTEKVEDSPYEKALNICSVGGHDLLRIPKVNEYIKSLLQQIINDDDADAEIGWVMKQRVDLGPKIQALKEYNRMKGRSVDKKQIEFTGLSLKELFDAAKNID